jgi:hypothetical protein
VEEEPMDIPVDNTLDGFFDALDGEDSNSHMVPLDEEIKAYILLMKMDYKNGEDFSVFWSENHLRFPILSRVATRVSPASACGSDVERLFSRAGYIFSPKRTNLKPRTLQYLTTMHYWYKTEDCDESNTQRAAASEARALKFASMCIDRVVNAGVNDFDSDAEDNESETDD